MSFASAVIFLFLGALQSSFAADITVCVVGSEGGKTSPVIGAIIQCWDRDDVGSDDQMTGKVSTGADGCAYLTYEKKKTGILATSGWDWPQNGNPDIYCVANDPTGRWFGPAYTTDKDNQDQGKMADMGTLTMYPDRVSRNDKGEYNGCFPSAWWAQAATQIPAISQYVDKIEGFLKEFTPQCNNHDLCYDNCDGNVSQESCDNEFKANMKNVCGGKGNIATRKLCDAISFAMYTATAKLGGSSFQLAQKACRSDSTGGSGGSSNGNNDKPNCERHAGGSIFLRQKHTGCSSK